MARRGSRNSRGRRDTITMTVEANKLNFKIKLADPHCQVFKIGDQYVVGKHTDKGIMQHSWSLSRDIEDVIAEAHVIYESNHGECSHCGEEYEGEPKFCEFCNGEIYGHDLPHDLDLDTPGNQ